MLNHLKLHLTGKVVIIGIGNTLCSDDGVGSLLASRLQGKVPFIVYDVGASPENYLGKIIKDKPDNIIIIDAADIGVNPGEFRVLEDQDLQTTNLFSTHNASMAMITHYLKNDLKVDIIILLIQPKKISFGDGLSQEISETLSKLENWFMNSALS